MAICGRRPDTVAAAAAALEVSSPSRVLAVALDVTAARAAETFAQAVVERFGRCDGLVNNAG